MGKYCSMRHNYYLAPELHTCVICIPTVICCSFLVVNDDFMKTMNTQKLFMQYQ